jgi:hypothetical protein
MHVKSFTSKPCCLKVRPQTDDGHGAVEATEDLLLGLLGDKTVEGHASSALFKLKSKRAAEIVKTLPADASPLAKKYAKKLAELNL